MTLIEEVEAIRVEHKEKLDIAASRLKTIIEVHSAVCTLGSTESIRDTRARAVEAFTAMLGVTEHYAGKIIQRAQEDAALQEGNDE